LAEKQPRQDSYGSFEERATTSNLLQPTKVSGSLNESLESNKGFRIVEIESGAVE
jgi:hypothetical protein